MAVPVDNPIKVDPLKVGIAVRSHRLRTIRRRRPQIEHLRQEFSCTVMLDSVRVDKWLWAVRLFKTRALAAKACANGKVAINNNSAKPSRHIHIGDLLLADTGEMIQTLRVKTLIERRVGASVASACFEDLTSPEERAKSSANKRRSESHRPRGSGRPTKKDRRSLESFFNQPLG